MKRRSTLLGGAAGLVSLLTVSGCQAPPQQLNGVSLSIAPDAPALVPARQLGLTLADLPDGFRLSEELAPSFSRTGMEDPFGRLSAYSATFAAPPGLPPIGGPPGDVVSSVNSYAGAEHARRAFAAWQAALPRAYRPVTADLGLAQEDSATFVQDRACMVGFRHRNVFASIWVACQPASPESTGAATQLAARYARLLVKRIDSGVR